MAPRKKQFKQEWKVVERRWFKRNGIPNGFKLALVRKDKTKARSDLIINRYTLPDREDDKTLLSDAIRHLKDCMITDLDARGLQIVLFDPSGERVFGGKFMETVRNMPGRPTEEEKEQEALEDALIDEITEQFGAIYSVGFQRTYYPDKRLRAIIRALVEVEGEGAVMEALKAEGLA